MSSLVLGLNMVLEEFKTCVLPVKNKLYRFALRFLNNEDEAQDVVQEVFIKAWDRREELHLYRSVEAWCMQVTRNLSLNRLKSGHYRSTEELSGDQQAQLEPSPYDQAETRDVLHTIDQLLQRLPQPQQQVLQLRDMEGYAYQEIGEILEMPLTQVKVNLFRARKTLREQLTKMNAYGIDHHS
ncbi:MAG: RNA polymerase sigma factor [Bacteroidota bacterium]